MNKIIPSLLFNGNAEEAVEFYLSVFKDARITSLSRYTEAGPLPEGTVSVIAFEMNGSSFIAINADMDAPFTPAFSFTIMCGDQTEVDYYWNALTANGGAEVACGWLTDRFGLSWQIVPELMTELLQSADAGVRDRAMRAMMQMTKMDIAALRAAAVATT